jgi:hypothetical protein
MMGGTIDERQRQRGTIDERCETRIEQETREERQERKMR